MCGWAQPEMLQQGKLNKAVDVYRHDAPGPAQPEILCATTDLDIVSHSFGYVSPPFGPFGRMCMWHRELPRWNMRATSEPRSTVSPYTDTALRPLF